MLLEIAFCEKKKKVEDEKYSGNNKRKCEKERERMNGIWNAPDLIIYRYDISYE